MLTKTSIQLMISRPSFLSHFCWLPTPAQSPLERCDAKQLPLTATLRRCFDDGISNKISTKVRRNCEKAKINRACELAEARLLRAYVAFDGLAPSYAVRLNFATVHRFPGDKMDVSFSREAILMKLKRATYIRSPS